MNHWETGQGPGVLRSGFTFMAVIDDEAPSRIHLRIYWNKVCQMLLGRLGDIIDYESRDEAIVGSARAASISYGSSLSRADNLLIQLLAILIDNSTHHFSAT